MKNEGEESHQGQSKREAEQDRHIRESNHRGEERDEDRPKRKGGGTAEGGLCKTYHLGLRGRDLSNSLLNAGRRGKNDANIEATPLNKENKKRPLRLNRKWVTEKEVK